MLDKNDQLSRVEMYRFIHLQSSRIEILANAIMIFIRRGSLAIQRGDNIKSVSQLLDHASIQTTNNYVGNVNREQLSGALELLRYIL